jgi:formyltetrahydrofolate-dependent phosphoribosylglycinamide formyltransferase
MLPQRMFRRLQKKWKVNGLQLALILCTFAVAGSLTGYSSRKLMDIFDIQRKWTWVLVYAIIVTLLWPLAALVVSIFFGQFNFFKKYTKKIGRRMGLLKSEVRSPKPETNIAIFASGAGSNTERIIDHFRNNSIIKVALIVCNDPGAGVVKIAEKENIPPLIIEKEKFFRGNAYLDELKEKQIDFIVLAGFIWKIPGTLLTAYPGRIINIHPALLPKHGGKGMYGNNVHAAVIAAGEKESGITIHYVDGHYDNGDIIFQLKCPVLPGDTPDSLAQRIHKLEHEHYPKVIEKVVKKLTG